MYFSDCEMFLGLNESQTFATSWRKSNTSDLEAHAPYLARIHSNIAWIPVDRLKMDKAQYYEVDFRYKVTLRSVSVSILFD